MKPIIMLTPAEFTTEQQQRYQALFEKMRKLPNPFERKTADYAGKLGLVAADLPLLVALTTNEGDLETDDSDGYFATLHAAYALGGYRDEAASRAMIEWILQDIAHSSEPVYEYLDMFLPEGLFHLPFLLEAAQRLENDTEREVLMNAASEVAQRHESVRDEVVGALVQMLKPYAAQERFYNTMLLMAFLPLKPVEHIDFIRELYAAKAVEVSAWGDIEDVEIYLGLRNKRATPKPNYILMDAAVEQGGVASLVAVGVKVGRNEPCPCGSGKKYKKCCMV